MAAFEFEISARYSGKIHSDRIAKPWPLKEDDETVASIMDRMVRQNSKIFSKFFSTIKWPDVESEMLDSFSKYARASDAVQNAMTTDLEIGDRPFNVQ